MLKKIIYIELVEVPDKIIVKFQGYEFPFHCSYIRHKEEPFDSDPQDCTAP